MSVHVDGVRPELESAVVVRVEEHACHVVRDGTVVAAGYAPQFPTPHVERVFPGHRVALAVAQTGQLVAIWRWYDAVVIDSDLNLVRLWESALSGPGNA